MNSRCICLFLLASSATGFTLQAGAASSFTTSRTNHNLLQASRASLDEDALLSSPPTSSSPTTDYPWDKKSPKTSLYDVDTAHTASPWMLNIIEAGHYVTVLPTLVTIFSIVDHVDTWQHFFGGNSLQLALWIMAPFFGSIAVVIPPVVHHMYEDWQVAPSQQHAVVREEYNNARLQTIMMNMLFALLTFGNGLMFAAYMGVNASTVLPLVASACACLWDKNDTLDKHLPQLSFPEISVGSMVGQAMGFTMKAGVYGALGWQAHNPLLSAALLAGCVLEATGGIYEGVVGESTFRQWDHLIAVIFYILGGSLQAYAFWNLPQFLA